VSICFTVFLVNKALCVSSVCVILHSTYQTKAECIIDLFLPRVKRVFDRSKIRRNFVKLGRFLDSVHLYADWQTALKRNYGRQPRSTKVSRLSPKAGTRLECHIY